MVGAVASGHSRSGSDSLGSGTRWPWCSAVHGFDEPLSCHPGSRSSARPRRGTRLGWKCRGDGSEIGLEIKVFGVYASIENLFAALLAAPWCTTFVSRDIRSFTTETKCYKNLINWKMQPLRCQSERRWRNTQCRASGRICARFSHHGSW